MVAMTRRFVGRVKVDDTGSELIEFALVVPLLLLIVAGIVDFGFMFQRYEVVTNAAREGARIASLPGYTPADVTERVRAYLTAGGLTPVDPVVTTESLALASGSTVNMTNVVVDYPSNYMLIGPIAALVGASGWNSVTLRGRSAMRIEGGAGAP